MNSKTINVPKSDKFKGIAVQTRIVQDRKLNNYLGSNRDFTLSRIEKGEIISLSLHHSVHYISALNAGAKRADLKGCKAPRKEKGRVILPILVSKFIMKSFSILYNSTLDMQLNSCMS